MVLLNTSWLPHTRVVVCVAPMVTATVCRPACDTTLLADGVAAPKAPRLSALPRSTLRRRRASSARARGDTKLGPDGLSTHHHRMFAPPRNASLCSSGGKIALILLVVGTPSYNGHRHRRQKP